MKIGFIGLGHMGKTLAKRLISEGVDLIVWNRTREKAEDMGVEIAENPASMISRTDMVFMNLLDSDAAKSVLAGKGGLLEGNCKGKIVIDTTTNHFESSACFHEVLKKRGGYYLETPNIGSIIPASRGQLTVLVSGEKEAFERARPYIEKIGSKIFYLEEPGLAIKMKLINNLLLGTFMASVAEAVVLGESAGLPREKVLEVLSAGAGNSTVLNAKKENLLKEDFEAHFKSSLMYKDLHYLQDLSRYLKKPMFTGSLAKELYSLTFYRDMDTLDFSVIYEVMKDF